IAAGKYNDGSKEARVQLTERMYAGIKASEEEVVPAPIAYAVWTTQEILPPARDTFVANRLEDEVANKNNSLALRIRAAMKLSWLRRCEQKIPIVLSGLAVNNLSLLHLPAESFLEYQLRAQQFAPDRFVACAAYGDGGPWYIPVKEAYPQEGYEVSVANCADAVDGILTAGITELLKT